MGADDASLNDRLRRIEDQLAIYQVISAYGPSADSTNMKALEELWHEDGVYDVEGHGLFVGRAGLKEGFEADFHVMLVTNGAAHASTLPHVVIEGDRASATHQGMLFLREGDRFGLIRLIASRWELVRAPSARLGWLVTRRTNRLLDGGAPAQELLGRVFEGPGAG
jgi:SnoaL-like domain